MAKKYISLGRLSIASELLDFVNNELLPDTGIEREKFWAGLDKYSHELAPKNKKILEFRDNLQRKIDIWHKNKKGKEIDIKEYSNFLEEIGYLQKEGKDFKIETKNVDSEISSIPGPQLVVPVMNARYSLNAANARGGSLYNALYGTDLISESNGAERGKKYNYIRGEKVIEYARNILDSFVPLQKGSWKDLDKIPEVKKESSKEKQARVTEYLNPLKSCLSKASTNEKIDSVKSFIKSWIENWFKNPELVKTLNLFG